MSDLVAICHGCPRRKRPCGGADCLCLANGKLFTENAEHRLCPLGSFRLGLGDYAAIVFRYMGLKALSKLWTKLTGKGCGCGQRQKTMNDRFQGLYVWLKEWSVL